MKRLIATILAVVLLVQAVPVFSLAEGGSVIGDAELREALLLTGQKLDGGKVLSSGEKYHTGMKPDPGWDARMLRAWVIETLDGRLFTVTDTLQRFESVLTRMKVEDAGAYSSIAGGTHDGAQVLERIRNMLLDAVRICERLELLKDRLDESIVMVEQMTGLLKNEQLYEYEAVRYSEKIRYAARSVRNIREEILASTAPNAAFLEESTAAVNGTYSGNDPSTAQVYGLLGKVFDWESRDSVEATATVSAASAGSTLQGRLRAAGSGRILGGDSGDAKVHIRTENEVYIRFFGEDNQPLAGVQVTLWDENNPDRPSVTETSGDDGYVNLTTEDFISNRRKELRLSFQAVAEPLGYQDIYVQDFVMARGEDRSEYLSKLDGPYIYKGTFQGYDIMRKEWKMLFATVNDYDFDLEITVRDPNGEGYGEPVLHYERVTDGGETESAQASPTSSDAGRYTFTGPWKQLFSPEADVKPYITFGTEGKRTDTLLASTRSAVDQPTYAGDETTSPLNTLLKDGFGFKYTIPITDDVEVNIGFDLPLSQYWPKVSMTPGALYVTFGSELTDPEQGTPLDWKNTTAREYESHMADWKDLEYLARKDAELGAAYKYYKSGYARLIQETKLTLGWFGVFSARWEEDAGFDTWLAKVGGSFGMILAFSYDVTWPFALGPVPLYMNMNIGLSAGFSAGLNAEFAMAGGDFTSIQFAGFGDLTIELAFTLTFTLGIGIKGMISAYVSGTACLNLAIAVTDNVPPSVTPSFSAYVKVGVEVLFFNMSVVIMEYPRSSAAASGGNATLFDLFMSRAAAEEEPEVVEPVSQTPLRYPQLAPEATKELDNVNGGNRKVRVVNVKGYDIAFYIAVDEYNWKILYWENLTTGDKGMADEQEGDYLIYDFDVSCDDAHIYTVVLKARIWDDQLLPDADADCHGVMAGYSVNDDGSLQSEGDVWFYSWQGLPYRFVADPRIEWASLDDSKLRMISSFGEIETFGHRTSAVSIERRGYEDDAVVYHSPYSIRSGKASGNKFSSMRALVTDDHDFDPSGTERTGWIALSAPEKALGGGSDSIELFDRAMYQAPDDSRQSIVLATGDITDYRLLQIRGEDGQYTRTVFYTDTITGSAGGGGNDGPSAAEIFRLKGIYLEPKQETGDNAFSYTAHTTDYDVSLPSGKFELQNVGTTPVLYWLGTAPAENKDDPVVWRLNCVAYDPATDTMSDTFVVSEFTLPDTDWNGQTWPTIPGEIMLTEGGTGYLTTMPDTAGSSEPGQTVQTGTPPLSLYSFPVDLKPVLDMQSLTLADTLVTPGQMVDATMTLMNEGNLDIAGVDFELVQVLDDGSEGPVLETLHSDFLDPTQSNLTMADGTVVLSGEEAIYRQEDFIYSGKQHDWAVARDDTTYTVENGVETSEQAGEGETQYVRTDVMVPGAMAAYNASIRIPEEQEWSGDIMLRLRATRLVSYTHMQGVRASAALAGNGGFTMPEGARKLVYELDRSRGRMVLREDSLRGAGMEAGLYSEEITAPTLSVPVQVEHQDITVDYRLGTDYYGEPMLDIIIGNMVNNRESIRLTCAVYPDGSDTPYYVSLPYYEEFVSAGKTHTISMPLKDFADPAEYSRIRVVILGVGTEECNYTNNEFTINLRGISSGQFAIVQQPEDATVQEGETAEFTVVVEGGVTPYTYRWEVWMGKSAGWLPIEGAGGPTLTLKNVTRAMDGWKYRCLITDVAGKTLTTREALLTVIRLPATGDSSSLPLYLGIAAVSLALLLITRRKRRAQ